MPEGVFGGRPQPKSTFRRGAGVQSARKQGNTKWQGPAPSLQQAVPSSHGPELTHTEAAEYIASLLEGLRLVAQNAQMPFLAYLVTVALEEAKNEKANRD